MPFRVMIGNIPIECDSVEEALDIARRAGDPKILARASGGSGNTVSPDGSRWTSARVAEFFRLVEGKQRQRRLIDALIEHSDGRTDRQLLQLLGSDNGRTLSGVLSGLWKNARKVGADPKDLYTRRAVSIGGEQRYEYAVTESFRKAAERAK